jgi:hypothetical protein
MGWVPETGAFAKQTIVLSRVFYVRVCHDRFWPGIAFRDLAPKAPWAAI